MKERIILGLKEHIRKEGCVYIDIIALAMVMLLEVNLLVQCKGVGNIYECILHFIYLQTKYIVVGITVFTAVYFSSNRRTRELTDKEYNNIKEGYVYCYTEEENIKAIYKNDVKEDSVMVDIKPINSYIANVAIGFKKSIYTYINRDGLESGSSKCLIKVPVKSIGKDKLRIRKKKGVIAIKGGYTGPAKVEAFVGEEEFKGEDNILTTIVNIIKNRMNLNDLIIAISSGLVMFAMA